MTGSIYPSHWLPNHPDRIQLYAAGTPNGRKISIALEEMELPYEVQRIDLSAGQQFDPEYRRLNPNGKIPSIIDPDGPGGEPLALMESGAILLYLAEKSGKLSYDEPRLRWEVAQWLMFQMAGVGPYLGQFGHFNKFARGKTEDGYALARYTLEGKRILGVLNDRLEGRDYLVGPDYTIADVATFPWLLALDHLEGKEVLEYDSFTNVQPWVKRCSSRPGAQRGIEALRFE